MRGRAHPASRLLRSPAGGYPELVSDGCSTFYVDAARAPTSPSTWHSFEQFLLPLPPPQNFPRILLLTPARDDSNQGGPWTRSEVRDPCSFPCKPCDLGRSIPTGRGFPFPPRDSCGKLPERQLDLKERGRTWELDSSGLSFCIGWPGRCLAV